MPRPSRRTRSKKRSNKTFPGGERGMTYKRKTSGLPLCSACGQPLFGTSGFSQRKVGKLNKGKKRIWRIYGGNVCHKCLRGYIKKAARAS